MRLLGLTALLAAATCAFSQTIANPANGTLSDDLGVPQSVPETESLLPIPAAPVKDVVPPEPATGGAAKGLLGRLGDGLANGIKNAENAVSNSVAVLSGGNKEPAEAVEQQNPAPEDPGQVLTTTSENSPVPQPDAPKPDGSSTNTEEQSAPVVQEQPSVQTENKVSDGKTSQKPKPAPVGQNKVSLPAEAPLPEFSPIIPAQPSPQAKVVEPDIPKQVPQDQAGSQTQKSPPQDQKEIQKPSLDSQVLPSATKSEAATMSTQASQTIQKQETASNSATIASTSSQDSSAKTTASVPSMSSSSSSKNPAAQVAQGAEPNSANLASQRAAQNPQSGGFPIIGIVVIVMIVIVAAVIIFMWQRNIRMATRSRLRGDGFAKMPEFLEDDKQRIDDIESVIGSRRGA
ncbi:hypothetical protein HDU77_004310 [Chytriomyces hyalinus]|nr:hypothetical protein HDU77_004310 [Chytriomyces hyalinus]